MTTRKATGKGHDNSHFKLSPQDYKRYLRLREEVFERDGWRCQGRDGEGEKCLKTEQQQWEETRGQNGRGRTFDCHHINGQPDDLRKANLLTVCSKCHRKLHPYRRWTRYYGKQPDEWDGEN